jgi:hypothetical protein
MFTHNCDLKRLNLQYEFSYFIETVGIYATLYYVDLKKLHVLVV